MLISVVIIVFLLSIGKNLNLTKKDNLVSKFINNYFSSDGNKIKDKDTIDNKVILSSVNKNNTLPSKSFISDKNHIFEEISKEWGGLNVVKQNDNIESKNYKFIINKVSTSKKLGEFNYCNDLGHVDEVGNTVDGYSYFIVNVTIECLESEEILGKLSLKNLYISIYKGIEQKTAHELLTANNDMPTDKKNTLMVKMDKGEKRNFNLVFLVEDEFINDKAVDFYLYINERGISQGTFDENKFLVQLDFER